MMMSEYFSCLAVLALAAQSPLCDAARQKISKAWPYNFYDSGQRVRLIKISSTGGAETLTTAVSFYLYDRTVTGSKFSFMPPVSYSLTLTPLFASKIYGLFINPNGCFFAASSLSPIRRSTCGLSMSDRYLIG